MIQNLMSYITSNTIVFPRDVKHLRLQFFGGPVEMSKMLSDRPRNNVSSDVPRCRLLGKGEIICEESGLLDLEELGYAGCKKKCLRFCLEW